MLLINRVKLYSLDTKSHNQKAFVNTTHKENIESVGNKNSTICCILSCDSPLSESKDYKILTKVFEKLMMKIENVYVVNIQGRQKMNFIHFIHEYSFHKIILFGEESLMSNIPVAISKNQSSQYELLKILYTENLVSLTESTNTAMKKLCWDAIQNFYKL